MLVVALMPPPSGQDPHQAGQSLNPKPDVRSLRPDLDALDKQPDNPRLLGGKQLVPEWIKFAQCGPNCQSACKRDPLSASNRDPSLE